MNTSHTKIYSNPKLENFFAKIVDDKDMANILRRATYLIALSFIRSEENKNPMSPEWTDETFYFLNELAECLDPMLDAK